MNLGPACKRERHAHLPNCKSTSIWDTTSTPALIVSAGNQRRPSRSIMAKDVAAEWLPAITAANMPTCMLCSGRYGAAHRRESLMSCATERSLACMAHASLGRKHRSIAAQQVTFREAQSAKRECERLFEAYARSEF